ncbi:reverse trancriptase [Cucumis melo var. makuwa]|uniref:Reverse trancriptase n=1 Tax=Cucumis melo var. makuwa TaxID=1194695 RepID=A0A5A7TJ59_CUCMM|nr:reverse trancriptase [Cucumis melo var. makuwa]TYK02662.1 reverse trancriptase [Cucumis melo var. makuwa]
MLLSLVVQEDLELEQLDVKNTFLHSDLTEEIYMNQPQGYIGKDDMLLARKSKTDIKRVKTALKEEFDVKELGESKRILGIDIFRERTKRTLTIDQSNYCYKLQTVQIQKISTMLSTWQTFPTHKWYMANPDKRHWEAAKWVLRGFRQEKVTNRILFPNWRQPLKLKSFTTTYGSPSIY